MKFENNEFQFAKFYRYTLNSNQSRIIYNNNIHDACVYKHISFTPILFIVYRKDWKMMRQTNRSFNFYSLEILAFLYKTNYDNRIDYHNKSFYHYHFYCSYLLCS